MTKRHLLAAFPLFALFVACSAPPPPPAVSTSGARPGARVDCPASEFEANDRCFPQSRAACDSLGCASGCDIVSSRTSRKVICSANANSSSGMSRCGGIAGWQCPENMVCADDPQSHCKRASSFDCIGRCVPSP